MPGLTEETRSETLAPSAKESPKPKVVYDYDAGLIEVTVIVSKLSESDDEVLWSPVVAIPGVRPKTPVLWTVIWELVAGEGVDNVEFEQPGVERKPPLEKPQRLQIFDSRPVESFPAKWQVNIKHDVTGLNFFQYSVYYKSGLTSRRYDPTIVVCQDPVGQNL